jgi:hypothetical protein
MSHERMKQRAAGGVIAVSGHRHGHRTRSLTGTFGTTDIKVPRAARTQAS